MCAGLIHHLMILEMLVNVAIALKVGGRSPPGSRVWAGPVDISGRTSAREIVNPDIIRGPFHSVGAPFSSVKATVGFWIRVDNAAPGVSALSSGIDVAISSLQGPALARA